MISIIICSINKTFALQVQKSIGETIGVKWEAIIIDNTINPKSITEVYNIGAAKAAYDILCFIHEDIIFTTNNWGIKLVNYFSNNNTLGLIGVAGSKYKSKTPSGWFTGNDAFDCCNITHVDKNNNQQKIFYTPTAGGLPQNVVVLDGVFLCAKKTVWQEVKFNDTLLKDFHLYDVDFSFNVAQKYRVIVVFDIDLLHFAKGAHFGNKWLKETLVWHKTMKTKLPFYAVTPPIINANEENRILKTWLIRLKHENITFSNKLIWLKRIKIWNFFSVWPFVFLFLFKSYLKKGKS
jgi:Glycosyltransferase like family